MKDLFDYLLIQHLLNIYPNICNVPSMMVGLAAIIVRKQVLMSGWNLSEKNRWVSMSTSLYLVPSLKRLSQRALHSSLWQLSLGSLFALFSRFLLYWVGSTHPFSDAIHNNYLLLLYSVLLLLVAEL